MNHNIILIGLSIVLSLVLSGCNDSPKPLPTMNLERAGGIVINDEEDLLAHISEGLIALPEQEALYGLDFRSKRPFRISVSTGKAQFLSSRGKGPLELMQPVQIIKKNDQEFYVYDS